MKVMSIYALTVLIAALVGSAFDAYYPDVPDLVILVIGVAIGIVGRLLIIHAGRK